MERLAIALIGSVFGFMTGVLAWFVAPQALEIPYSTLLVVSVLLAGVFFVLTMLNPDGATRLLGKSWDGIALISRQILFWIRLFK